MQNYCTHTHLRRKYLHEFSGRQWESWDTRPGQSNPLYSTPRLEIESATMVNDGVAVYEKTARTLSVVSRRLVLIMQVLTKTNCNDESTGALAASSQRLLTRVPAAFTCTHINVWCQLLSGRFNGSKTQRPSVSLISHSISSAPPSSSFSLEGSCHQQ